MDEVIKWLVSQSSWITYRTLVDLVDVPEEQAPVQTARQAMLTDVKIRSLLLELAAWPGPVLRAHNDATHLLHKLVFVADLGLKAGDPGLDGIIQRVLDHQSPQGVFQLVVNIKPAYGGLGEDQFAWMLCDAPLTLYALIKLGLYHNDQIQQAIQHLSGLVHENGWPCAVSPDLGKFRGPGRKSDPCPYANLAMLKVFSLLPEADQQPAKTGAETLLSLWERRKSQRPYLFAMGSGFEKLKAPLIWYDILHVTDVLTSFNWLHNDARLGEMLDILQAKAGEKGRFTPDSIWTAWKDWEFGQKKQPSGWITFLVRRALKRVGRD